MVRFPTQDRSGANCVDPATRKIVPFLDTLIAALTCTCSSSNYQSLRHVAANDMGKADASMGNQLYSGCAIICSFRFVILPQSAPSDDIKIEI